MLPMMRYSVVLIKNEEGYAVGCPALPGCWTQGATRDEALENIRIAIQEVLEVKSLLQAEQFREEGADIELANVEIAAYA